LGEPVKEAAPFDPVIIEDQEAIINLMVAIFPSTVSQSDPRYRQVVPLISDPDCEDMRPLALPVNVQLGPDGRHGGSLACPSDPKLHGQVARGIDDELLRLYVIVGFR
jgi:hypothetical protein